MLALDPAALRKLLVDRRVALVSGTNGKTTTTHFLAAAIQAQLGDAAAARLVHNADGANLHRGLVSALAQHPGADIAVLETDERVVADVVLAGRPEALVLLNLSRDQLDRHHEIAGLARSWRDCLRQAGPHGPVVVANACEPLIVWAAQTARRVVWVDAATNWTEDSSLCPSCGSNLTWARLDEPSRSGGWHCAGCDLAQPKGDYVVNDETVIDRHGHAWKADLAVPGRFNVSNAACALAAAEVMGVAASTAMEAMRRVSAPAGRYATTRIEGTTVRLMLAKNPAGWAAALPLVRTETVVLAVDSATADGADVSWLWDVDFEQLTGRLVVASGTRAQDLAVRLSHAGIPHRCVPALSDALHGIEGPVDVIATYSPFQRLRKLGGV